MAVECPAAVLDDIRLEVLEAFYAFRRGGAEAGGVLFGVYAEGRVRIAAYRRLPCEHASGPGFVLSENDCERLNELLRAFRAEPALAGLSPVGWYHSHTRSGIFLSPGDVGLHERFFREPWQIALVLRTSIQGTRAGFFARDAAGKLAAEASPLEFDLAPLSGREMARPQAPREAPAAPPPAAPPKSAPAPPAEAPRFLLTPPPPRRRRPRPSFIALAVLALVAATALATRAHWLPPVAEALAPEPIALVPIDAAGHLGIRWSRKAAAVRRARGGTLEIADGRERVVVALASAELQSGSFVYLRRGERVDVVLKLEQQDGRIIEERAGFAGLMPEAASAVEAELRRRNEELEAELRHARTEMLNRGLLVRKLREAGAASPAAAPAAPR